MIFSSQPATDEDNKRTASVWDGLRRKARRCKCIVVACWRGKKETKNQRHDGVWFDKSDVSGSAARLSFTDINSCLNFLKSQSGLLGLLGGNSKVNVRVWDKSSE